MSNIHEEEKLGKAYDARLMRRLMQYLRPYKWRVVLALTLVAVVTPLELAPPWLFWRAIDGYFTPTLKHLIPESAGVARHRVDQPRLSHRTDLGFPSAICADSHHATCRSANYVRYAPRDFRVYPAHAYELLRSQPGRPPRHARDNRR